MSKQDQKTAQSQEKESNKPAQGAELSASESVESPGIILAKARENMGLTQKEVADRLHLRLTSVQAVESDAFEEGVSVTFTKGYVRLYAKLVNLEAEPLLLAYDRLHAKESQPAKLQSFSRRVSREAHDNRWNMVSIVVVLLVLGSVVVWWVDREGYFKDSGKNISEALDSLISSEAEDDTQDVQADLKPITQDDVVKLNTGPQIPEEAVATLTPAANDLTQVDDIQDEAEQLQSNLQNDFDEVQNEVGENINAAANNVKKAVTNVTDSASSGRMPNPSRGDIIEGVYTDDGYRVNADGTVDVVFTFKDDCWVSVKDGNGGTMAIGTKTKGRVMTVSGVPPVSVILGAPQSVNIEFGGLAVNMSVYPGGESAKFSLPVESE